jgi:enoyl-CoA hydratase/carnithine racemase
VADGTVEVPGLDPDAHLLVTRAGEVVTVTLDRPQVHNAQTPATWYGLAAVGRWLPGDVRAVVIAGNGRSFSSGLDRTILGRGDPASLSDIETYQRGFTWLREPSIVTVAAVQGYALGAGCQLALACDLRVLADDAQLALPEPSLGLVPDLTGTHPLVHAVGYARALEMCLTGRRLPADECLRIGLANAVVPVAELTAAVTDLVASCLAPMRMAVVETKALLQQAYGNDLETQRALERAAQARRFDDLAALLQST